MLKKFQKKFKISNNFSSDLARIIPLNDFNIFLVWTIGIFQVFNCRTEKIIHQGEFEKGAIEKEPDALKDICAISETKVAYYNKKDNNLDVYDISSNSIDKDFSSPLPTKLALPDHQRNPKTLMRMKDMASELIGFQETETVVLHEKKSQNENVITVFTKESCPGHFKQTVFNSEFNNWKIEKLDQKERLVLYPSNWNETEISFLLWNVHSEKDYRVFIINEKITTTIISITDFGSDSIAVWMNEESEENGVYGIVKYKNENQYIETKLKMDKIIFVKDQRFFIGDVLFFNYKNGVLIIESLCEEGRFIDVYRLKNKEIILIESIFLDQNKYYCAITVNGKCILSNENDDKEDQKDKITEYNFDCIYFIELRCLTAYILKLSKMIEIYGPNYCENILDMLYD